MGGQGLASRAADALAPICESVLISVRGRAVNPAPEYAAVEDAAPPGRGPLAGIDAGFEATGKADLLVLACDYPRVETALLKRLLTLAGDADELVLVRGHPLVALWRRTLRERVRVALEQKAFRVGELVHAARARALGPESFPRVDLETALLNLNRPEDLERLERGS